jgi:ABC-type Mn2+/Zn2+ transport system permease subunit
MPTDLLPLGAAVLHDLAEPWRDELVRRALVEVTLLGVAGGTLGCWIVLYGLSYGAESLAHGMFPGLVLAAVAGFPLLLGGAGGMLVAALAVALAGRIPAVGRDTAIAVVVTTLFGLGVLLALTPDSPPGIQGLLFGDVLGVSDGDLALAAGLDAVVLGALWILHPRLLAAGFDRLNAPTLGVSPTAMDAAVLVLLALAVVVAVRGLGNLLVVAVLVGPAATARLLARRAAPMMAAGAAVAIVGGIAGLYVSYYAETAAGASVAGAIVILYLAALAAVTTIRGTHGRRVRNRVA